MPAWTAMLNGIILLTSLYAFPWKFGIFTGNLMPGETMMRLASAFLFLSIALSACANAPPAPGLEGSSWSLARFEPSGGGAAVLRPDDPARYTMSFGKDGRLAAKLDCNRGTGPWQATVGDAHGGSLRIGPLATTRAMCPPDEIGAQLTRDLDAVSGYRLQDGRLYTVLPANAGTYVWERITP